ncbi:MAG TPA: hypothetical protein VFZ59_21255 [Verrucomicrobiae bacterium]|nr:hypothetical protein [Verrucomicrobiae bacterium]
MGASEADDQAFGQAGNDRFVWNPGDDTDLNEGGSSTDTVEVNGGNGAEQFTVTANGTRVRFDRLDPLRSRSTLVRVRIWFSMPMVGRLVLVYREFSGFD